MAGVNQLLPFANSDVANVIPFDEWDALPARLSGFQSGIASSKQFNYILGQGGAAGYVIGQLVADYTTETATIAATPLYQAFKQALATYVPTAIADGSIAGSKIANGAITSQKLASDSVTNDKLADNSVGTANLQSNAVTSDKMAAGSVGTSQLANGSVTAAKMAANSVGTTQITDSAVTFEKISPTDIATQSQAETGTADDVLMTPQRTQQAIAKALSTFEVAESDGVTIEVNDDNKIQAKDIAIGGDAADLASSRGQIGNSSDLVDPDFNALTKSGSWRTSGSNQVNAPSGNTTGFVFVLGDKSNGYVVQWWTRTLEANDFFIRTKHGSNGWQPWRRVLLDVNIDSSGLVSFLAAQSLSSSQKNQACENIGALRTTGGSVTGDIQSTGKFIANASTAFQVYAPNFDRNGADDQNAQIFPLMMYDQNGKVASIYKNWRLEGKKLILQIGTARGKDSAPEQTEYALIEMGFDEDGVAFATAPSPKADSNDSSVATTKFVNDQITANKPNLVVPLAWRETGSQPGGDVVVTVPNLKVGQTIYFLIDANNSISSTTRSCFYNFAGLTDNTQVEVNNPQNRSLQMFSRVVSESTVTITMDLNGCSDMSIVVFGVR